VLICADGLDPAYVAQGVAAGTLPALTRFAAEGFAAESLAAMPTFTNPNNMSLVTGAPPSVHGVSGNFFLDRATREETMMLDERFLRAETIPAALSRAGTAVAVVTAKDKLRRALGAGLDGICFSAERAADASRDGNGIAGVEALVGRPTPDPYSADLSLFVLDAGLALLRTGRARLLYLSLSDYVQHAYAPGAPEADAFLRAFDARLAAFAAAGALVALTADHGMSDKAGPDGAPNVVYLEDRLSERFGPGAVRVICPIADPFTRHHGALGGFVRGYVFGAAPLAAVLEAVRTEPLVAEAMTGAEAARRFDLPPDREGDFVAIARADAVIGARREEHDVAALAGARLRSHGGTSEQTTPFIVSAPVAPEIRARAEAGRLRNWDLFDVALNGVAP
jgi:phosphonoacetate hydrolase